MEQSCDMFETKIVEGTGLVTIPKQVYLDYAKHVLTYAGSKIPDDAKWREVMGLLVGRNVVGNVDITEYVPFAVGKHDDVAFDYAEYVKMAALEPKYNTRDPPEFFVGWAHSHFIGHKYSGIDIHNHLGWQNHLNPYAIGLVFDPQLLSWENPGFCCLRLDDPNLGEASPVAVVDYVIQIPKKDRRDYEAFLKRELPSLF
ncbi:MAG: hypothetical protein GF364_08590 [Candidatus Lokiarchaeota archaeon]|nr:hypothetical protein [Candidatus Lokiarchaeota archaeon]